MFFWMEGGSAGASLSLHVLLAHRRDMGRGRDYGWHLSIEWVVGWAGE